MSFKIADERELNHFYRQSYNLYSTYIHQFYRCYGNEYTYEDVEEFCEENTLNKLAFISAQTFHLKQNKPIKLYRYFITWTLSSNDKYVQGKKYIDGMSIRENALSIKDCRYIDEIGEKGNKHFHMDITTTIPLKKDRFKHYIDNIGFIDIRPVKNDNGIEAYMLKQNKSPDDIVKLV